MILGGHIQCLFFRENCQAVLLGYTNAQHEVKMEYKFETTERHNS
jgi:hypothetical protein